MDETEDDLLLVRDVLARELETINSYLKLLRSAKSERVRAFLAHVTDEEKEHVAEALEIIKELDPVQAALLERGPHAIAPAAPPPSAILQQPLHGFTVGSLRKKL
jgi:rubrerythrin